LVIFSVSCSVSKIPAKSTEKVKPTFDVADFDRFYVEGLRQKLMGNSGEALRYFEQCLKLNPESDAVYYQMAQIVASTGDASTAIRFAVKANRYDNDNLWYLMMLSQLYYKNKNIDSAIIWYEKAEKLFPENENVQLTLGNLYVENGELDKANTIFENFDIKYGVNDASTLMSVRILMSSQKYDEAEKKVKDLLILKPEDIVYNGLMAEIYARRGEKDKADEIYSKLFKIDPDNPQIQLSYANFLIGDKRYDELFSHINIIALNGGVTREEKIQLFAELSQNSDLVSDKENRLARSLLLLEASHAGDDIIPLLRTDLMLRQGKGRNAVTRLEELIKVNPRNYFAWEKLLFAYLELRDFENLTKRGEECSTRFNMSFVAKILYANGAMETGKFDIALAELNKAEILASGNSEYALQVITLKADLYYRTKQFDKAFSAFDEALKYNMDDYTILNNYAYYLAEQNTRLKDAEEMAKRVVRTEGENATFLDTYGWVLYKRGKYREAAKVFDEIINKLNVQDAELYEHYGHILRKLKKCSEASEMWLKAMELDPDKNYLSEEIKDCRKQ
jgi:Tfp pilus assembly protein PilF